MSFEDDDIDKYPIDEIPLNRDCFLMSANYMTEFNEALKACFEEKAGVPMRLAM